LTGRANPREASVAGSLVRDILIHLESRGCARAALCRASGIDPGALEQPENALVFRSEALDRPILSADAALLQTFQQIAESLMVRTDVALLLGFSELSAFYRASKRWTGTTPIALRAAAGSPSPSATPPLPARGPTVSNGTMRA
jgi:methylphosphotriester-DNA--protein-cysteine methyltransferase